MRQIPKKGRVMRQINIMIYQGITLFVNYSKFLVKGLMFSDYNAKKCQKIKRKIMHTAYFCLQVKLYIE